MILNISTSALAKIFRCWSPGPLQKNSKFLLSFCEQDFAWFNFFQIADIVKGTAAQD